MKIGFCIAAFVVGCQFAVLIHSSDQAAPATAQTATPTELATQQDAANATDIPMLLQVVKHSFASINGEPVSRYVCINENGMSDRQLANGGYLKHSGVSMRTQHLPDSPNRLNFPSTILQPSDTYRHTWCIRFRLFIQLFSKGSRLKNVFRHERW